MSRTLYFALMILLCCAACQNAPAVVSLSPVPTTQAAPVDAAFAPTQTPRTVREAAFTVPITATLPPAPSALTPSARTTVIAQIVPSPLPANAQIIGYSVQGRSLTAHRFGTGTRLVLLVGGMHGGWEANTIALIEALIAHFAANPTDVLPDVMLVLIPAANPDGLVVGRTAEGRFNANGVDLNRNWPCEWSAEARWQQRRVNPGAAPLSEPETRALADFITVLRPAAVLFYHSAAGGVFGGACGGNSLALEAVVGEAAGYSYGRAFSAYPVTGTAPSWVDSLGIPSVDVELASGTDTEFERNLRAVLAVQRWLTVAPSP